jgi:hypothetical protein
MDLPGTTYLLSLATISITFVAFSTIVVVFRQSQGAGLAEYEMVLLRLYVISGLEATIFSLLPPLLGLFDMTPVWIWRLSSLVFAVVLIWRGIYFVRRQTRFQRRRLSDLLYLIYFATILGLLVNALGILVEPGPALYALAATWLLVNAMIAFAWSLERFLHPPQQAQSDPAPGGP